MINDYTYNSTIIVDSEEAIKVLALNYYVFVIFFSINFLSNKND